MLKTDSPTNTYGEMWGREIGSTTIDVIDTYYNITGLTEGETNGVTFDNSKLIINTSGTYSVSSQFSFNDGANTEFHLALGVNGIRENHCHTERKLGTGGDVGSASFTCIDMFNVGDVLTVMVENVVNTNDPDIRSINLNIIMIGETN